MSERYLINGQIVDIPKEIKNNFLQNYPNAERGNEFDVDGEKYFIPLSKQEVFIKQYPNASSATNPNATFNRDMFTKDMSEIAKLTENSLKTYYGRDDIQVKTLDKVRTPEEQAEALASGASRTEISVHNYGAGADFQIFMGGKLVDATGGPNATDILKSTEPYQILGNHAREKDYFWGWEWDSGHVGETRFVNELFLEYPELADNDSTRAFYEKYKTEAPLIYKDALSTLDQIYETPQERTFTGQVQPIEDLLPTIKANKMGFNSTDAQAENILENEIDNIVNDNPVTDDYDPTIKVFRGGGPFAFPTDIKSVSGAQPLNISGVFATEADFMDKFKTMEPNLFINETTQRFTLAIFNELGLGYPAEANPKGKKLLEEKTGKDVWVNTFGQFFGMMLPLGYGMKVAGGIYKGLGATTVMKEVAKKLPKLSKVLKEVGVSGKYRFITEQVGERAWKQGTVSAMAFALHGQAMHHDERGIEQTLKELKSSAFMGYGFGSLGAVSITSKYMEAFSYPAMFGTGMLMVPDDPDDPLNGSRKYAMGMALMTFHGMAHGETVKTRANLKGAVKDLFPQKTIKEREVIENKIIDNITEIIEANDRRYYKNTPMEIGKDGKPVDIVSQTILDPTGKPAKIPRNKPVKTAVELAMEGMNVEKSTKYDAIILDPKSEGPVQVRVKDGNRDVIIFDTGRKGVSKEQLEIARGIKSQMEKLYNKYRMEKERGELTRAKEEFYEIELQEMQKMHDMYVNKLPDLNITDGISMSEIRRKELESGGVETTEVKTEPVATEVKTEPAKKEVKTEPTKTKPVETKPTETKPVEPALDPKREATMTPDFTEEGLRRTANIKAGENVKHTRIKNTTANQELGTNIYKVSIRGNEIIFGKKKGTNEWIQIDKDGNIIDIKFKQGKITESNSLTEVKGVLEKTTKEIVGGERGVLKEKKGQSVFDALTNFQLKNLHETYFGPNRKNRVERINELNEMGNIVKLQFYSNNNGLRVANRSLVNSNPLYFEGNAPSKASYGKKYRYDVTLRKNEIYDYSKDPLGVKEKYPDNIKAQNEHIIGEGFNAKLISTGKQGRVEILSNNIVTVGREVRTPNGTFSPVLSGKFFEKIEFGALQNVNFGRIKNVKEYYNTSIYQKWQKMIEVLTAETNTPIDITQTVSVVKPRKGPDKGRYVLEPSLIIKIGSKNDATVNYIKDKLSINTITQLIKKQVNKERFSVGPQEIVYRFVPSRPLKGGRIDKRFKDNALEYQFQVIGESTNINKIIEFALNNNIGKASYDVNTNRIIIADKTTNKKSVKLEKIEAFALENSLIDGRSTKKLSGNLTTSKPNREAIKNYEKNPNNFTSQGKAKIDKMFSDWTKEVFKIDNTKEPVIREKVKLGQNEIKGSLEAKQNYEGSINNLNVAIQNAKKTGAPEKEITQLQRQREIFKEGVTAERNKLKDAGQVLNADVFPGFSLLVQSYRKWKIEQLPKEQGLRLKKLIDTESKLYNEWVEGNKSDKLLERRLDEISADIKSTQNAIPEPTGEQITKSYDEVIKNQDTGMHKRKLHLLENQLLSEKPNMDAFMLEQLKYQTTGKLLKRLMDSNELTLYENALRQLIRPPKKQSLIGRIFKKGKKFNPATFLFQAKNRVKEPSAKELIELVDIGQAKEAVYQGKVLEKLNKLDFNKKMSEADGIRMSDILEGKIEPKNKFEVDMAQSLRSLMDAMYNEAVSAGMPVSKKLDNYFPRLIKQKYKERIYRDMQELLNEVRDPEKISFDNLDAIIRKRIDSQMLHKETIEAMRKLQETGQAKNAVEAYNILQRYSTQSVHKPFANLVKERQLEFPEYFYERDARKVIPQYIFGWGKSMAHTEVFGPKGEVSTQLLSRITSSAERDLVRDVVGSWTGDIYSVPEKIRIIQNPGIKGFMEFMTSYNVGTKIGLGTATIPNIFQLLLSVYPVVGEKSFVKGGVKLLSKERQSQVRSTGAVQDIALRSLAGFETTSAMGKISEKILNLAFNPINKFNAYMSASIGEVWIKDLHAIANRPKDSSARKYARNRLSQYGFNYKEPILDTPLAEFMYRFATDQQLLRNVTREAVSMNHPLWKHFFLFKKFGIKQPQLIKDNFMQAYNAGGKKELLKYITRLGVGSQLSGEAIIFLRNYIKSELSDEDYYRTDSSRLQRVLNNSAFAGTFGMYSDFIISGIEGYETENVYAKLGGSLAFALAPANITEPIETLSSGVDFYQEVSKRGWENALYRGRSKFLGRFGSLPKYYGYRFKTPQQKQGTMNYRKAETVKRILTAIDNRNYDKGAEILELHNKNQPNNLIDYDTYFSPEALMNRANEQDRKYKFNR